AGEPEPRLGLARIGVAIEQRLGRDEEARRAEAALQRRVLEELLLQRVQLLALSQALDRLDRLALGLGAEHQARADEPPVDDDAAGAAIARAAAFLAAGEMQVVAQHVEQRLLR